MAYHNVVLDEEVTHGGQWSPSFKTTFVRADSGFMQRNIDWDTPLRKCTMSHVIDSLIKLDSLLEFFINRRGSGYAFKVKDWSDFTVRNKTEGALPDGDDETIEFQTTKKYISTPLTTTRTITKIKSTPAVQVFVNDILQADPADYTIDLETGLITFVSAPGNGLDIDWRGEFYLVAIFASDKMDLTLEIPNTGDWSNIKIEEVRGEI